MRSPYEVLGVPRHADETEIRAAFRRQAAECHPDRNPDDKTAHQRFTELNSAYQILNDPEKRAAYDRYGDAAFRPGGFAGGAAGGVNLGDFVNLDGLFGDLLGAFGVRLGKSGDIRMKVTLSFLESARGTERPIDYTVTDLCPRCQGHGGEPKSSESVCGACEGRGRVKAMAGGVFALPLERPCPHCHGRGRRATRDCTTCRGAGLLTVKRSHALQIPAGVQPGSTQQLRGEGNRLSPDRPAGSLLIEIEVEPHEYFRRRDDDIICQLTVGFAQAALGAEMTVPTINGEARLKIPAGTQPGAQLRMRGKGFPRHLRAGCGDQLVEILVEVPKQLSPRARELVTLLGAELGQPSGSATESLLGRLKRWL